MNLGHISLLRGSDEFLRKLRRSLIRFSNLLLHLQQKVAVSSEAFEGVWLSLGPSDLGISRPTDFAFYS